MAQATLPRPPATAAPAAQRVPWALALSAWVLPAGVVLLGFALRLFQVTSYSMWVDEVYTVEYARLPWDEVLGLRGAYDNHPPVYYTLVKLFAIVFPEPMAPRALSVLTGTATIAVLYLLVRGLVNRPAALLSSFLLAISPLHIWYSQDGRMYAPTAFAVCLSYAVLLRFMESPRAGWGAAYVLSLLVAMFMDYSALYGLAPQGLLVAYMAWRARRIPKAWLISAGIAGLLYLPWAIELTRTIFSIPGTRDFLIVTRTKIFESVLTVTGLPGQASYYWGDVPTPWSEWPEIRPAAVAIVAALLFLSSVTLCGRYRLAFVTGALLMGGTVATAAILSYLVSPGYADRTVVFAVLGWVMLAGSAPFGRMPNGARSVSLAALAGILVLSTTALGNVYRDAQKEPYEPAAEAAAASALYGFPIYADEFMGVAITAYHEDVVIRAPGEFGRSPALVHAYGDYSWLAEANAEIDDDLVDLGFERVLHQKFEDPVSMAPTVDLYVRESASLGEAMPVPAFPDSALKGTGEIGWRLLALDTEVVPGSATAQELIIYGNSIAEAPARLSAPATPNHLYLVSLDYWVEIPAVSVAAVRLDCRSVEDGSLLRQTTELTGAELEAAGWQRARAGIICPAGTTMLEVTLSNAAVGELRFRNIRLAEVRPID
jgi:4-amino-4-deoxy-L-arabinose transferase-like glycosyltransferase